MFYNCKLLVRSDLNADERKEMSVWRCKPKYIQVFGYVTACRLAIATDVPNHRCAFHPCGQAVHYDLQHHMSFNHFPNTDKSPTRQARYA